VAIPPFFFAAVAGILVGGAIAGARNGREMDRRKIAEHNVPEKEWKNIPDVCRAIEQALQNGERTGCLRVETPTSCYSPVQKLLVRKGDWVAKEYAYNIVYK